MSLRLDKSAWKRVALGDVAGASKEKIDPTSGEVERYVAGEHMDTDDLMTHRWGGVSDGYLGPAFHRRFRPGQVLYGSRRTYLRKVAVAEFDGVTANTTFVLNTKDESLLLQEFLPFIMSSEPFHAFAIQESKGSVNPYVNWSDIERYDFDLPPLDEQRRLSDLLWTVEREARAVDKLATSIARIRSSFVDQFLRSHDDEVWPVGAVVDSLKDGPFGSKIKSEHYAAAGVRVLRLQDVQRGRVDGDAAFLDRTHVAANLGSYRVESGDVVIAGLGDETRPVGRAALAGEAAGAVHKADVFRARVNAELVRPAYFVEALNSEYARPLVNAHSQGTTRLRINTTNLKKVQLPFPSLSRQDQLLAQLTTFDAAQAATDHRSAEVRNLERAVRAEVFGGLP